MEHDSPRSAETRFEGAPSASERAYRYVGARLGWDFLPGTRLPLDRIATALHVSRQPVRDAVQRLAGEGLVTIVAQIGCIVVRPERQEIHDLCRVIAAADAIFVPVAAQRATPSDLGRLAAHLAAVERLSALEWRDVDESEAVRLAIRAFYSELYHIGATATVADVVTGMRRQAVSLAKLRFFDQRRNVARDVARGELQLVHQAIGRPLRALFEAIAGGDADLAGTLAHARALSLVARAEGYASEPFYSASTRSISPHLASTTRSMPPRSVDWIIEQPPQAPTI